MSDTDWRSWAWSRIASDATVRTHLSQWGVGVAAEDGVMSTTNEPPGKHPFIMLRMGAEVPGPFQGVSVARLAVHVHDRPGDYLRIGSILRAVRSALVGSTAQQGQVVSAAGAVGIKWQGDSADLSDPDMKTIFRTSDYDLFGKDGPS